MRSVVYLACMLLSFSGVATNQARAQTVDDSGLWLATFGQDRLGGEGSKWKWWFDGHLRFFDDADGFYQSIARPGIGRAINDHWTAWTGYGWIHTINLYY